MSSPAPATPKREPRPTRKAASRPEAARDAAREREAWMREAEAASRRIADDPREAALLDELEWIQAEQDIGALP